MISIMTFKHQIKELKRRRKHPQVTYVNRCKKKLPSINTREPHDAEASATCEAEANGLEMKLASLR